MVADVQMRLREMEATRAGVKDKVETPEEVKDRVETPEEVKDKVEILEEVKDKVVDKRQQGKILPLKHQ